MKSLLPVLFLALFLANCSPAPVPPSPEVKQATIVIPAASSPKAEPSNAPQPSLTPNIFGLTFIAQYDPTRQILTIYGTTPAATIVFGGTPLLPPPTATASDTPVATFTPAPSRTRPPVVAPSTLPSPSPVVLTQASLQGKIMFKSTRDGGLYPNIFSYYAMNPDGSGIQRLDKKAAEALYIPLQSREGLAPDGKRIVLGERRCYGIGTCSIYILDTVLDAALINSNNDIGKGEWFLNKGSQAKDPVWSPNSQYIVFVSNHETDPGCLKTQNLFKGTPDQKPVIRRLTGGSDFCSGGDAGHPSFSPDGSQVAFWGEGSGSRQIYILNVGASDDLDYRYSNAHIISDHKADDWDPLWVK